MNAYDMRDDVRGNLFETTADHWTDKEILRKLNQAQRRAAIKIGLAGGDWLIKKSSELTPSSNLITLPSDCSKPVYMEQASDGYPIEFGYSVRDRRTNRQVGTSLETGYAEGYLLQDEIEINADSFTDTVYLWYQRRVPDLMFGTAGTGSGASALVFPSGMAPHISADYYNGVGVEIVSGTGAWGSDTITDYSGTTMICTVTGTYGTDSVFGTVGELPEEVQPFLVLSATMLCLAKPSAAVDPKYFEYFKIEQNDARKDFEQWISGRKSGSHRVRTTGFD